MAINKEGQEEMAHQSYPKTYRFPDGTTRIVNNAEEEMKAAQEAQEYSH